MAAPILKNRRVIRTAADNILADGLKELSKQTDIPQSKLLDQALRLLFDKYNYNPEQQTLNE